MTAETAKPDFYHTVTDNLTTMIEEAQASGAEWVLPWHRTREPMSLPVNGVTGHTYQGGNVLNLWLEGMMKGFTSNEWASARQWHEANPEATIKPEHRRGGSLIHFVGKVWVPKDERTGDPEEDAKKARPFMKTHFVYNRDQIDGLPAPAVTVLPDLTTRINRAEDYFKNFDLRMLEGGNSAFYLPSRDVIQMPNRWKFRGTEHSDASESWYATLFHEAGHATGHHTRLKRDMGHGILDGESRVSYAKEELVAELAAAFACAHLQLVQNPRRNPDFDRATYLASWLEVLRDDPKALANAASAAREAHGWMNLQQPTIANKTVEATLAEQADQGKLVPVERVYKRELIVHLVKCVGVDNGVDGFVWGRE